MAHLDCADDQPHDEAEALLSWYATGQLDARDRTLVEDHLESCLQCRQQLFVERRMIDEYGTLVPQVESGWNRLRAAIDAPPSAIRIRAPLSQQFAEMWRGLTRPPVMGVVAAQAIFLLIGASLLLSLQRPQAAQYHALSSAPAPASANVIVMFQAHATEEQMRTALKDTGASLVGGPTAADAYLVHVDAKARPRAIAKLQADRSVTLAQPIDGSAG